MTSYVLSDFRPYRENRCDPCTSKNDDDWDDDEDEDEDEWNDSGQNCPEAIDHAARNRHLQVWDGYGVGSGTIDCDAMIRSATIDASLMGRADGRQLSTRVFVAAPALAMKRPDPSKELSVISGIDTSDTRRCYRLGEENVNRFNPGVCAVPIKHIIPPWTVGGAFSRDISRDPEFQKAVRRAARCDADPVGADDPTDLSYGPSGASGKHKKKQKQKQNTDKKAEKARIKLETMAAALPRSENRAL